MTRPRIRSVMRVLLVGAGVVLAFATVVSVGAWGSLGASPQGARLARIARSPQWRDGAFHNVRATWTDTAGAYRRALFGPHVPASSPDAPIMAVRSGMRVVATAPFSGLRATWFGHSSTLLEVDGARIVIDPIWSERASPISWAGPRLWFSPPVAIDAVAPIDAVIVSHDHYDHLDRATIQALNRGPTMFVVPLGLGAHLEAWGVASNRIAELDWWEHVRIGKVVVTATPARHSSGRISTSSNRVLWAGFAMMGSRHRIWYSGDTGWFPEIADIGTRLGPFDLTLIESGQYDAAWPDKHLSPEAAVEAHRLVRGRVMLPVHWGRLSLAPHGWTEPAERAMVAAKCAHVSLALPRPGESFEPNLRVPLARWWPDAAWRPAAEAPVRPTADGAPSQRLPAARCE